MKYLPILLCSMVSFLRAEGTFPALATAVSSYQTQVETISKQRDATIKKATDDYVAALVPPKTKTTTAKSAEAALTGDAGVEAVIQREKKDIQEGVVSPAEAKDFPMVFLVPRRNFVKVIFKAEEDAAKARKALDAKYFEVLQKIQIPGSDQASLDQLAAEKRRILLSGTIRPITDLRVAIPGTKWQCAQAPQLLRSFGADMRMNNHWNYSVETPDEALIHFDSGWQAPMRLSKDGRSLVDQKDHTTWKLIVPAP